MSINRRTFLKTAGWTAVAAAADRRRAEHSQWRAQAFGYTGDPNAQTPAIDALARESVNFRNAVSGFPVCSPYRASLMTGQYAVRHGLVVNDVPLKPAGPTLTYVRSIYGPWLLYDNQADPYQKQNLAGKGRYRDLQARLERMLDKKLKADGDDFLPGARYVERANAQHYREVSAEVARVKSPLGDWESTWQ